MRLVRRAPARGPPPAGRASSIPGRPASTFRPQIGLTGPFGQALVEFALVVPLMFALMLAFGEMAFMHATLHTYQNGAEVLADWVAARITSDGLPAGWLTIVAEEQARTGCQATPEVAYPDGAHEPGDRVLVTWPCRYTFHLTRVVESIPMTVSSEAVVP